MFIPEELYKKILELAPIACVDIVVRSPQGILLVKRTNEPANGQWWFPGGRIFKHETFRVAAARKLKEEIDLEVVPEKLQLVGVGETDFDTGPFGVSSVHTINVVMTISLEEVPSLQVDNLHSGAQFFHVIPEVHSYVRDMIERSKSL